MARKKGYKHITITPQQGGALVGSASDDIAGSSNYTRKLNFRRDTDGELRREGWELFDPTGRQTALDNEFPIRLLYQFPASTGEGVLIAAAGGNLYRLQAGAVGYAYDQFEPYAEGDYYKGDQETFWWKKIYEGLSHMDALDEDGTTKNPFEGGAYRWEAVTVLNHVVISNGVDLPLIYKAEWDYAQPLYSLREQGVVCCGTIASFQDRLFLGDLSVIIDGYDNWFKSADDPYGNVYDDPLVRTGAVKIQRYQYRMFYSMEQNPKMFDTVESGGMPAKLTVQSDGSYKISTDYKFKVGNMGEGAPLITESSSFLDEEAVVINSGEFGIKTEDEKYAINTIGLTSRLFLYKDGDNYILRNENGDNPGFLSIILPEWSSQNSYPTGTSVRFGASFYKATGAVDAGQSNPEGNDIWEATEGYLNEGEYEIMVFSYLNNIYNQASTREFADDGTRILKMEQLADKLVVYRDSGFFFLSRSNVTSEPFAVEPRYTGGRVADYRHTVTNIDGKRHIFLGSSGVYSISRASAEPEPVAIFELGVPFWKSIPPEYAEFVYASDNPVTRELFLSVPVGYMKNGNDEFINQTGEIVSTPVIDWGTIAFDYITKTLSEIDASFTASCFARKPRLRRVGPEQSWFLMGLHASEKAPFYIGTKYRPDNQYDGLVVRYGYGPPEVGTTEPYRLYDRLGYGYKSELQSGLIDFGDSFSDKEVRSYVLELSNKYGVTPVDVIISTTSAVQGTEEVQTMSIENGTEIKHVTLNRMRDENMIPLYVRAPYIRDSIRVRAEYDVISSYVAPEYYLKGYIGDNYSVKSNPMKIVGKTYEVSGVDSRQATQATGQG
jgi:hypothetical protein